MVWDLSRAFGEELRRVRKEVGIAQGELATRSGLHRTTISLLEKGKREPKLETIFRLAKGLGRSPGALLDRVAREQAALEGEVIEGILERALDLSYEVRERGDSVRLRELEQLLLQAMVALKEALALVRSESKKEKGSHPPHDPE
jgi:transcriptional regulator with XRE-family HTH domain